MRLRIRLGLIGGLLAAAAFAGDEHEVVGKGRPELPFVGTSALPKPPVVRAKGKVAATAGDVAKAGKYLGIPQRTWNGAFEFCASTGERLANREEVETVLAKHRGDLTGRLENISIWSSTQPRVDKEQRFFKATTDGKGDLARWYRSTPGIQAKPLCLKPQDPIKEIFDVCPVGNMDYCDGTQCYRDCDGKESTIGYFQCGNHTLAMARCLQNRMGRKSWQLYHGCPSTNRFSWPFGGYPAHIMNIVAFPPTKRNPRPTDVRYCILEPQRFYDGATVDPQLACWEGAYAATPAVPAAIGKRLCDDRARAKGWTGDRLVDMRVSPAGTVHMGNPDYARDPNVFKHLVFTSGIPGKDLLPFK